MAHRSSRLLGAVSSRFLLHGYGLDMPAAVTVGPGVVFPHGARGTVIHPRTSIGDRAMIFHGVTVGRQQAHLSERSAPFGGITIGRGAVLACGSAVLGGAGNLVVGEGTIVAANAVLLQSTGDWEIWAGVPAVRVGFRRDRSALS